jgi:hypothetical protein
MVQSHGLQAFGSLLASFCFTIGDKKDLILG